MIVLAKLFFVPVSTIAILFWSFVGQTEWNVRQVLDLVAIGVIVGGILVVNRYRTALEISDSALHAAIATADAWEKERNLEREKSLRLQDQIDELKEANKALEVKVAELQALPDLSAVILGFTRLEQKMEELANRNLEALLQKED